MVRFSYVKNTAVVLMMVFLSACGQGNDTAASGQKSISQIAMKYEGKIIRQPPGDRGVQDGLFLVKGGKRYWISNGAWVIKNGFDYKAVVVVPSVEFNAIEQAETHME